MTKVHRRDVKKIPMSEKVSQIYKEEQIGKTRNGRKGVPDNKMPNLNWTLENQETTTKEEVQEIREPPTKLDRAQETFITNFSISLKFMNLYLFEKLHEFQRDRKMSSSSTRLPQNLQDSAKKSLISYQEDEGVTLHIMESDLALFPSDTDTTDLEEYTGKRTVTLSNKWIVTDSVGNPVFEGLIEEDPNIDWLTFISNNISY